MSIGQSFPFLLLVGTWRTWQDWRGKTPAFASTLFVRSLLLLAGIGMMARMALAPRISQYGFFQALLAGSWIAAFVVAEYPQWAVKTRWERTALRAVVLALLAATVIVLVRISLSRYAMKITPIGEGPDRVYGFAEEAYPRHTFLEFVRQYLAANSAPEDELLVLPEGLSLNYFARRRHPLRIADALPATLPMNGRDVLESVSASPPEWVVFIKRDDTNELGFLEYGSTPETGRPLVEWILRHYEVVIRAGDYPFAAQNQGLWLLKLKREGVAGRPNAGPK